MSTNDQQLNKCEKHLTKLLKSNSQIQFMFEQLEKRKCALPAIKCSECTSDKASGFNPKSNEIILNKSITWKMTLADSINHELIHAYDACTTKLDWNNINHFACAEIRANALSGECRYSRELLKGYTGFNKHFQDCIKRRSVIGLCSAGWDEVQAKIAVSNVWSSCFNDFAPYDDIY